MTTAIQFLFPMFLGAFGGIWVVSNVSLEITDCRSSFNSAPWPFAIYVPNEFVLCWAKQKPRDAPGKCIAEKWKETSELSWSTLHDLLATNLIVSSMSTKNIVWVVPTWHSQSPLSWETRWNSIHRMSLSGFFHTFPVSPRKLCPIARALLKYPYRPLHHVHCTSEQTPYEECWQLLG